MPMSRPPNALATLPFVAFTLLTLSAPVTSAEDAIDFELLMNSDDLEMIEDLEFFAWLPEEELETTG